MVRPTSPAGPSAAFILGAVIAVWILASRCARNPHSPDPTRQATFSRRSQVAGLAFGSGNQFERFLCQPTGALKPKSRQDQGGNQHSNSHGRDREKYSGHRATVFPDPCATLAISFGSGSSPSRNRNARRTFTPGKTPSWVDYTLDKRVMEFETRTHTNTGAQSSQSRTVAEIGSRQRDCSVCACPMHDIFCRRATK